MILQASFPIGAPVPEYQVMKARWYSSKETNDYVRKYLKEFASAIAISGYLKSFRNLMHKFTTTKPPVIKEDVDEESSSKKVNPGLFGTADEDTGYLMLFAIIAILL